MSSATRRTTPLATERSRGSARGRGLTRWTAIDSVRVRRLDAFYVAEAVARGQRSAQTHVPVLAATGVPVLRRGACRSTRVGIDETRPDRSRQPSPRLRTFDASSRMK